MRRRRPPWYRRTWPLLAATAVAASIVAASFVWMSGALHPARKEDKSSSGTTVVATGGELTGPSKVSGQQLAEEVCTLPSLNGGWWFNEMPWLVPVVRRAMAEQLTTPQAAASWLGPNSPLAQGLTTPNIVPLGRSLRHGASRLCESPAGVLRPRQVALVLALMTAAEANLTDEKLADRWRTSMDAFSRGDGPEGVLSAEDLHTLAVLQHSLAVLGNDPEMTKTAKQTYLQALKEYSKAGGSTLQRLCRADYARLYADRPGSGPAAKEAYGEVRRLCEKALAGLKDGQLVLFRADTLITQGNAAALAATNANEYGDCDHAFRSAEEVLTAVGLKEQYHPLLAYVWESYAWCNMERWMIDEAKDLFTRAAENRRQNLQNRENRTALIHELHDRHGIAIVKRYRGQVINAIADFIEVLEDTRQALRADRVGGVNQRYARDLRERLYNSSERFGDAFLYQGAASDADRERLRRGCELYQTAYDEAEDRAVKLSMGYKRAIMLALMNKQSAAAVATDVKELDRCELGPEAERGGLLRQVAHAVIALQVDGTAAGQRKLCEFLGQFYDGSVRVDWKKRETLELQLFCAELLLSSELRTPKDNVAACEHVKYLDKLIKEFPFAEQRIPFLWRYIDLAVRAVGQARPAEGLRYVLMLHDPPQTPADALLAFQMHNDSGIAFFRVQGKVEAYPITEVGRRQIRAMARKGNPAPLDARLVASVIGCLREGQPVAVLWREDEARAPSGKALTDEDWPFTPPLATLCSASAASGPRPPGKAESPEGVRAAEPPAAPHTRTQL
jgi:tetratricopeptide (TPR) repeat protein